MSAKKRIITLILALILCAAAVPSVALAETDGSTSDFEEAIITGDAVNMRARPTTDSPVIYVFSEAARIGVYCEETDGWYRIIYGNYRGYVSTKYVFLSSTDVLVGNIATDSAAVHTGAFSYSETSGKLSAGTGVTITDLSGDFYGIKYSAENGDELSGYVEKDAVILSSTKTPVSLLKQGMEGVEVKKMQTELRKRGCLSSSATGYFGEKTVEAVKLFQKAAGVSVDGVAGAGTLEILYGDNDIGVSPLAKYGLSGKAVLSDWSKIKNVFSGWREGNDAGTVALVTDIQTGIQFKVQRFGGWYHADCHPLTSSDTAKMKKAAGGSWSWNRRAIWVTVKGTTYAASMNSYPHSPDPDSKDSFPGHFCIHFNGCKVHETGKPCPRHAAMIRYAYNAGQ